ncbi:type I-E CRISPR-associated protein Cas6/Cse3/CasE [Xylanimonas oleitrophica]|uniref:Type I-E CRISPR-associated protein Cas6/Cse3/CasE n=1 Tax=Xylanimonas oleitrophica TaxID=2607479 RepID=A0A2W5WKD5_9MICO|nr:type I-E CRISPR-associated protein Cas6/Cse3/CasE [Xylanimonas oleitrophica]PZR51717.1 type I-E CRISPR-associated protein Cas6/Cse3/CasE [Xylanimonas oleitrophica]
MHLSRIQINPARRGGRTLLGSPQAMHAAVLAAFPQPDDERGRVLWRVDRDAHQHWLYVVSRPAPDFAHVVEQAGWPTTQGGDEAWTVRPYGPLLDRLADGQVWAFRLTANPTRSSRATEVVAGIPQVPAGSPPGGRSKRYAHVTVAQQQDWLLDRAERWGFEVPEKDGVPDVVVRDRRTERFNRKGATVTIAKATFDGILRVTDAHALRTALVAGMGPAKGYGCGLLTLAPVG